MEAQHTPGPWIADERGVVLGGPGACTSVATTTKARWEASISTHGSQDRFEDCIAEAEANGRLIEAAPAMSEALERIAGDLAIAPAPGLVDNEAECIRQQLFECYEVARHTLDAIAKARSK